MDRVSRSIFIFGGCSKGKTWPTREHLSIKVGSSVRLFLALEVPSEIQQAVHQVCRPASLASSRIAWVRPENYHVTLKFLGAVERNRLAGLNETLVSLAKRTEEIHLRLAHFGGFPSARRAKVLWCGLEDRGGNLGTLVTAVEESLVPLGFARETKRFSGHLTVGRVRDGSVEYAPAPPTRLEWRLRRLVLFESIFEKGGVRYLPRALHNFKS